MTGFDVTFDDEYMYCYVALQQQAPARAAYCQLVCPSRTLKGRAVRQPCRMCARCLVWRLVGLDHPRALQCPGRSARSLRSGTRGSPCCLPTAFPPLYVCVPAGLELSCFGHARIGVPSPVTVQVESWNHRTRRVCCVVQMPTAKRSLKPRRGKPSGWFVIPAARVPECLLFHVAASIFVWFCDTVFRAVWAFQGHGAFRQLWTAGWGEASALGTQGCRVR